MKIAIGEWVTPIKGPSIFPKLKSLGIDGVQVDDWAGCAHGHPMTNPFVQQLYLDSADHSGIELVGMAGNELGREGGLIHAPGTDLYQQCKDTYFAELDACIDMDLPIHLAPAFFSGFPQSNDDYWNILRMLCEACAYAQGTNLKITLESPYAAEILTQVFESVRSDNFGIYYDIQNTITFTGSDAASDIRKLGPGKITQVHIKDGLPGKHGGSPLGQGNVDLAGCIQALRDVGYDGWLVLENSYCRPYFKSDIEDPWDRIAQDVQTLQKLLTKNN